MVKNPSLIERSSLEERLLKESAVVADDFMAVLEEFERFEEDFSISGLGGQVMGSERK